MTSAILAQSRQTSSALLRRFTGYAPLSATRLPPPSHLSNPFFKPPSKTFSTSTVKMVVHNIQGKSAFDEAITNKTGDVLAVLDCFATWCGPCKVIAPVVAQFSETYSNAEFYKVDVDESPDVAQELGIRAMPTFLLFKNGERVGEIVGANAKALEAAIKQNL